MMFDHEKTLGRYLAKFGEHNPIGYVVHAMFDDATSIEHALNDGVRFYMDDRRGSHRPWDVRFVPPYGRGCSCFTQWIYETPLGDEYFGDFRSTGFVGGRAIQKEDVNAVIFDDSIDRLRCVLEGDVGNRIGKLNEFSPADIFAVNTWFDSQASTRKKKILGSARFHAIVKRTGGEPMLFDFVDTRGDVLTAKEIRQEGVGRRKIRTAAVQNIFRKLARDHATAWEKGGGKWDLNPAEEERFGQTLIKITVARSHV